MGLCQFIFLMIFFLGATKAQSNGELRLYNDGEYTSSSGRLQIYLNDEWGNVCDSGFGSAEATVACQQLNYDKATSFSNSLMDSYGNDGSSAVIDGVTCDNSNYLHILQCDFSATASCSQYVSVDCSSKQIWSSPRSFDVRLQAGDFPSQGRVEYYISDQWSSVCRDHFDQATAGIVCQQLGYTEAQEHNQLDLTAEDEPILNDYTCCSQTSCLHECLCETVSYEFCESELAATVQCNFVELDKGLAGDRYQCNGESAAAVAITLGIVSAVLTTIIAIVSFVAAVIYKEKFQNK